MFLEDAVLFSQVVDHLKLVTIHPAGQRHEKDSPSDGVDHAPSLQAGDPFRRGDGSAEFSDSTGPESVDTAGVVAGFGGHTRGRPPRSRTGIPAALR